MTALITVAGPEIGDFLDSNKPICENAHDAVQNVKSAEAVPPQLRAAYLAYVQRQLQITRKCDSEFGS